MDNPQELWAVARASGSGKARTAQRLFTDEDLFDEFVPELPLLGLRRAIELSQSDAKRSADSRQN